MPFLTLQMACDEFNTQTWQQNIFGLDRTQVLNLPEIMPFHNLLYWKLSALFANSDLDIQLTGPS